MVQFHGSVKVLGYYLSDEERTLKRQWSAENHERMVEVKRQIKYSKMKQIQEKRLEQLLQNNKKRLNSYNFKDIYNKKDQENYSDNPAEDRDYKFNNNVINKKQNVHQEFKKMASIKSIELTENGTGKPVTCRSKQIVHPMQHSKTQQTYNNTQQSLNGSLKDIEECKEECERVTVKFCTYMSNISQSILHQIHYMASQNIQKDDMPALHALKNLIIPQNLPPVSQIN